MNALVPDLDNLVDGHVEKIAVVRDQHKGVGIVAEIFLQPVAGFEIEMVGGFVQQQQVGLLQQQLDQRDAHLPAAGKFFGLPGPVFFSKTQPRKHRADLGFDGVSVASGKFVLDALVAFRHLRVLGRRVVELGHVSGQLFHLLFHFRAGAKTPTCTRRRRCVRRAPAHPAADSPALMPLARLIEP